MKKNNFDVYLQFRFHSTRIPVSYTHLDVYKRQTVAGYAYDSRRITPPPTSSAAGHYASYDYNSNGADISVNFIESFYF